MSIELHPSSSSANSSFHATFGGGSLAPHNGSGGRHFRQRSEPLIPLEQPQPPPMQFHHSRTSSSTTSGEGSLRGFEAIGGARRKQQRHHEQLSLDKIHAVPLTNFMLGHGSVAPKMMSSPTRSIDMGYHTLNGDNNSLSPLEPYETSLGSINLACPSVSYVMLEGPWPMGGELKDLDCVLEKHLHY